MRSSPVKWQKATPELIATFERFVPEGPGVERRKMFGYPCAFVNGQMFMGCHQANDMILRLSESDRAAFLSLDGAHQFEPMPGRPMREYVVAPDWMKENAAEFEKWIGRALAYASGLPPKEKEPRRKRR
jgi:hypothetical protein